MRPQDEYLMLVPNLFVALIIKYVEIVFYQNHINFGGTTGGFNQFFPMVSIVDK
jgi:hypothetical protein